jgi:hypothetical protein
LAVSAIYTLDVLLLYSASALIPVRFGMTFPAMVDAGGKIVTGLAIGNGNVSQSTVNAGFGWWNQEGSGGTMLSLSTAVTLGTGNMAVMYKGMFATSNASGTLQLQAFASSGTDQIVFLRGSYLRLYRIA